MQAMPCRRVDAKKAACAYIATSRDRDSRVDPVSFAKNAIMANIDIARYKSPSAYPATRMNGDMIQNDTVFFNHHIGVHQDRVMD